MIKEIDSVELKKKIDNGENIVLIDCREQDEWNESHIAQAKFMPLSNFPELSKELDKNAEIIIQCRSGKRSMQACQHLLSEGHTNLTNLAGGILGWVENGYDVEK